MLLQLVCPFDGRVVVLDDKSLMVYPDDADMEMYEVFIAHVAANSSLKNAGSKGTFLSAGTIMGSVTHSGCSPNFIFVSIKQRVTSSSATLR